METVELDNLNHEQTAHGLDVAHFGPLNVWQALHTPAPTVAEVLPGFYTGTLGMLVAPGGTGKSSWALALALSVATSGDRLGLRRLGNRPWVQGRVLFWTLQDPPRILHRRIRALAQAMGEDPTSKDHGEGIPLDPISGPLSVGPRRCSECPPAESPLGDFSVGSPAVSTHHSGSLAELSYR